MAALSSLCREGRHEGHNPDYPWNPHVGCWGTARDHVDGRYVEHPCRCECHAEQDRREA
jgi:hypothetical protein